MDLGIRELVDRQLRRIVSANRGCVDLGYFLGIMGVISEQRSIEHSSMIGNRKNKGGEETTQKTKTGLRIEGLLKRGKKRNDKVWSEGANHYMSRPTTTARTVVGYRYPGKPYHQQIRRSCWTALTEPSRVDSFASLASSLQCAAIMIHAARCAPLPRMHEHAISTWTTWYYCERACFYQAWAYRPAWRCRYHPHRLMRPRGQWEVL